MTTREQMEGPAELNQYSAGDLDEPMACHALLIALLLERPGQHLSITHADYLKLENYHLTCELVNEKLTIAIHHTSECQDSHHVH